jgi:hypothetical protein
MADGRTDFRATLSPDLDPNRNAKGTEIDMQNIKPK